jgi:Acyl-CoA reductase (LuxC)
MNLPNYFLADLPDEATLTAAMINDACQTLKRNREQYLANRSTQGLIKLLAGTAENWLQPDYPFRRMALEQGPAAIGFSHGTLVRGLDSFFQQMTSDNLQALVTQDLAQPQRLDSMVATSAEQKANRAAMGVGPEFLVHIAAGNIPNPTWTSIVLGLLVRSAQFVKCASGTSLLPRLFAHSLYDAEPKLASCLEIAEWRGGRTDLESVLFHEADCVTATGSDETLEKIRCQVPIKTRFLGYGHRVSFGYIANEALSGFSAKKLMARAADDVVAWNQLGCLSPHVIYVEHGGGVSAEQFAEMLAEELERRESSEPRGKLSTEEAAVISSKRGFYLVRAENSLETRIWFSKDSTAWTVVYEADARFQLSCLNRFIYLKGVSDLVEALQNADSVRGKVSTVGLAASEEKAAELATQLARWGVTRVCPLGQMQNPPLTWRHDGRPSLGDLVAWTDWEL